MRTSHNLKPNRAWTSGPHRHLSLLAILLLATGIRLWNFDFDPLRNDEPLYHDAYTKFKMAGDVAGGAYRPRHFQQPYLLIYTTGLIFRGCVWLDATEKGFLWRLTTVLMMACSVAAVRGLYGLGRMLSRDRAQALLAALLLAVAPVSVIGARYYKEDIPLMLFMLLALIAMVRLMRRGRRWDYLLAGLSIGVAIATKYAAVGLVPFYVAAHLWVVSRRGPGERFKQAITPAFFGGMLLVVAGFLIFNPYAVADFGGFRDALRRQATYSRQGHNDGTAVSGWDGRWVFYLRHALLPGLTWPVLLAAGVGMARVAVRRRPVELFVLAWAVCFYIAVEASPAKPFPFFARYLHPLYPVVCYFAAGGALWLCRRPPRLWRAAGIGLLAASVLTPLARTCIVNSAIKEDTRMRAGQWMDAHLPAGACIVVDDLHYSPRPSRERFGLETPRRLYRLSPTDLRKMKADYLVLNSFRSDRYTYSRTFTDEAARIADRYDTFGRVGSLIQEFRPPVPMQTYGFHNPVIRIYRMPWSNLPEVWP